jgi:hypothetical protein
VPGSPAARGQVQVARRWWPTHSNSAPTTTAIQRLTVFYGVNHRNPILASKPVVRDHRPGHYPTLGPHRGRDPSPPGGVTVTNSNGQVVPTRLDGGSVHAVTGSGVYNPPTPIIHDHR